MPYASFVALLTHATASVRNNGLNCLLSMAKATPPETHLLIIKGEGMLTALEQFLTPENVHASGLAALRCINELTDQREDGYGTAADRECQQIVFSSPLMPRIVAATSVHRMAYCVIDTMNSTTMEKELFEYNGVTEAFTRGLQTDDEEIHGKCIVTIACIKLVVARQQIDLIGKGTLPCCQGVL
jgi:hypothetical protein